MIDTGIMKDRAPVGTLANLGAAFTETSMGVWCTWTEREAGTNFDGATRFCQFCGATDHEELA